MESWQEEVHMYRDEETRKKMAASNRIGMAANGMSIIECDDEAWAAYDAKILGFEDESPKNRALADIATHLLEAVDYEGMVDDENVGMVVLTKSRSSEAMDYGQMIADIASAKSVKELREIARVYQDMPGALELAKACAEEMGYREVCFA